MYTRQFLELLKQCFKFSHQRFRFSNINPTFPLRNTVVPGFRVLGFSALPGFRALKAGNGAWSVHKTLFGFKAPILDS